MNSLVHWNDIVKTTRLGSRAGRWRTLRNFCRRSLDRQKKKTPPAEGDEVPTMKKNELLCGIWQPLLFYVQKNLTSNNGKGCRNSPSYWFWQQRRGEEGIKLNFVIWKFGTPVYPHTFFKNTNLRKCRSNFWVLPFFGNLRFWRFPKSPQIQLSCYRAAIRRLWTTSQKEFRIISPYRTSYLHTAVSLRVIISGSSTSLHWR